MKYIIDETLAQAIVDYLSTLPYRNVAVFIDQLMKLEKVKSDVHEEEKK